MRRQSSLSTSDGICQLLGGYLASEPTVQVRLERLGRKVCHEVGNLALCQAPICDEALLTSQSIGQLLKRGL